MIEYLEAYAETFELKPRFGHAAETVRRDGTHWVVKGSAFSIRPRYVVIASGYNAEPAIPCFSGIEAFKGTVIHSSSCTNARPFAGQSVPVAGMGNTGAEIALDLAEGGATPTISIRNGVHMVPRELFGIPIQRIAMLATRALPQALNDVLFPPILDFALGYPSKYGIKRPRQGLLQQIAKAARIPVIDVGTVRKISAGEIKIAPNVSDICEDGALFADGNKRNFHAIILATGYRPNYGNYLEFDGEIGTCHKQGLFFVGYQNVATGLLHEISKESVRVIKYISGQRKQQRTPYSKANLH